MRGALWSGLWEARPTRKWLVIGLGNPGVQYERTRHNAGFAVLAVLAQRYGLRFRRAVLGGKGETVSVSVPGALLTLLRPMTYMNLSGEAVRPLMRREGFGPADMVLVYDDMDVALGRLRLRPGGSAGGHRGVASVIAAVGSDAIARVRVGIGRPGEGLDAAEYVLNGIPPQERPAWETSLERAADAVMAICTEGCETAMGRFNGTGPS